MKIFIFITITLLSFKASFAQDNLPKDQNGKITYTDIIVDSGASVQQLYIQAKNWIYKHHQSTSKSIELDSAEGKVMAKGYYLVYNKGVVSKQVHGAIKYNVLIEVKDNKYRYNFSDFVFEYYKQNRNYQYVPSGKEKPLEEEKFAGFQKSWDNHKSDNDKLIKNQINSLKSAMKHVEEVKPTPSKPAVEW
ncbi:DUF4468 domain-containing protein [Sporocytophaga myxococcoides]|uniref:DUF4468 domain-containing protein n=1 Tax=Sporocytophaga myxococcoides TaxID=153721 RepID=UPI0004150952|nr:DUF4468 domain-containing protein [Sporocytophaga myxococcoides]